MMVVQVVTRTQRYCHAEASTKIALDGRQARLWLPAVAYEDYFAWYIID